MHWRKAVNQTEGGEETLENYAMMHRKFYIKRGLFKLETDLEMEQNELKMWKKWDTW